MSEQFLRIGRRAFLRNGLLILTAAKVSPTRISAEDPDPAMNIGLLTDLHFADKPPVGTRHYRETLDKLAEAGQQFRTDRPAFIVELGDFVDAADTVAAELGYLKRVNRDFAALCDQRHYVLGNHCVDTLTKKEFLDVVE